MIKRTAILAGTGQLPRLLAAAAQDAVFVGFEGISDALPNTTNISAQFEKMGKLFDDLKSHGVTKVCFAGAMDRPHLNPQDFDQKMMTLAPRLMAAMGRGDDGLLREVLDIFSDEGFQVLGAHQVMPDLVLDAGTIVGDPTEQDLADIARAKSILEALGTQDVGQGAVVAGGQCLGIETLQGTNAMLSSVAATPDHLRRSKGVFVKAPKPGQDLRIDMPTIGLETVAHAINAGLAGMAISAGNVLVLEREKTLTALNDAGLFLRVM